MFSGIVEELGRFDSADAVSGRVRLDCGEVLRGARRGDSIAVSGWCLTLVGFTSCGFVADLGPAMRHDGRVGGHLATGHVDGVGTITATRVDGTATWVTVAPPAELLPLLVEK